MKLGSHALRIDSRIKNLIPITALDKHPALLCAAGIAPDERRFRHLTCFREAAL